MRPVFVVLLPPLTDDFPRLGEIAEQVQIEHLIAYAAVEAFDERILVRLAGLDVVDEHSVGLTPVDKHLAQELGAVFDP